MIPRSRFRLAAFAAVGLLLLTLGCGTSAIDVNHHHDGQKVDVNIHHDPQKVDIHVHRHRKRQRRGAETCPVCPCGPDCECGAGCECGR